MEAVLLVAEDPVCFHLIHDVTYKDVCMCYMVLHGIQVSEIGR